MKNYYHYEHSHYDGNLPVYLWILNNLEYETLLYCNLHRELEFIQVTKGTLNLYIDEMQLILNEGDIGIINTNRTHYGHSSKEAFCEIRVFVFDIFQLLSQNTQANSRLLTALTQEELWLPSKITQEHKIYVDLTELLEQLSDFWNAKPAAYELKLKALLLDLLFLFLGNESLLTYEQEWGTPKSREKKEKLLSLIAFLELHYHEELSVPLLADALYMGEDTFYKFMRSMAGVPPMNFVSQFRLKKAAELLSSTNLSVTEVCFRAGFSNVSYFIKCFRTLYGCTPKKYK